MKISPCTEASVFPETLFREGTLKLEVLKLKQHQQKPNSAIQENVRNKNRLKSRQRQYITHLMEKHGEPSLTEFQPWVLFMIAQRNLFINEIYKFQVSKLFIWISASHKLLIMLLSSIQSSRTFLHHCTLWGFCCSLQSFPLQHWIQINLKKTASEHVCEAETSQWF